MQFSLFKMATVVQSCIEKRKQKTKLRFTSHVAVMITEPWIEKAYVNRLQRQLYSQHLLEIKLRENHESRWSHTKRTTREPIWSQLWLQLQQWVSKGDPQRRKNDSSLRFLGRKTEKAGSIFNFSSNHFITY